MFFPDKADAFRSFISHTSSTSKVAASIVVRAALIVFIGAASPPGEALSPGDGNEIQKITAIHPDGSSFRLRLVDADPAWYADLAAGETAVYVPPAENPEIEASMVNGHIQAF